LPAIMEFSWNECHDLSAPASDHHRVELQFRTDGVILVRFDGVLFSHPCYAYGAGRRLASSLLGEIEGDPTRNLFSDDAELRNAEEWLLRLDCSASKPSKVQQQQAKRREQVKELLVAILPEVDDIRFTVPTSVDQSPGIEFRTPYGWIPLRRLG